MEDMERRVRPRRQEMEESPVLRCMDDVLEIIFGYIKKPIERNAISAVCKRFHEIEARTRHHILVYNMYAVNPVDLFRRFPSVKSITMKGNPRLVDFDIIPRDWAGHCGPWVAAIKDRPQLNRFRIKRMGITDRQIEDLCAACGPNLQIMQFDKCTGFSTTGLLALSKYCKNLTHLGLAQSIIENVEDTKWLKDLVNSCLALEVLDLSLIEMGDVEEDVLVKLASRCKVLKLWESQNPERFQTVLHKCSPNLIDLGIERINCNSETPLLAKCTALEGLFGIFDLVEDGMQSFLSVSSRLKRLDLSYANLTEQEIAEVLNACPNLQYLRVLDRVGDHGLSALGNTCKDLQRLVVESPSELDGGIVTDVGLMAVAQGCRNLQKVIFYASFLTNEAFQVLAYNCPQLMDVRICLIHANISEEKQWECLDEGVTALVRECESIYRLTLTFDGKPDVPLLTDAGVAAIGEYGKKIRVLTLVHCGSTDGGLIPVLRGCAKLQRLEIRKSPFGDESMQEIATNTSLHLKYLHVQGCEVTEYGVKSLAYRGEVTNSKFYVEVIGCRKSQCVEESGDEYSLTCQHWQILAYHSLTSPRDDTPPFIQRIEPSSFPDMTEDLQRVPFQLDLMEEAPETLELMPTEDADEDGVGVIPEANGSLGLMMPSGDEALQLMSQSESGSIRQNNSPDSGGGIDLNEPAEDGEAPSTFQGFRNDNFFFSDIIERGHLGTPLVSFL